MSEDSFETKQLTSRLGSLLRKIRTERALSLDELAEMTSVSRLTLGNIERGEANPTLTILWKIANGLSLPLMALLPPDPQVKLSRAGAGLAFESTDQSFRLEPMFSQAKQDALEMYRAYLQPQSRYEPEPHHAGATEVATLMSGRVEIAIQDQVHHLQAYDAIRFKADEKHSYYNAGDSVAILHLMIRY